MATPRGAGRKWRFRLNDASTLEVSTPPPATEKQVRRRGRVSLAVGAVVATLALATMALAVDNLGVDGDGLAAPTLANNPLAFGDVCPGDVVTKDALVFVEQSNTNTTNIYGNGATVSVTRQTITNPDSANGDLTAPMAVGTIDLPSDWNSPRATNKKSDFVTSQVTLTVPATATPGSYPSDSVDNPVEIQYRGIGKQGDSDGAQTSIDLTRNHDLKVTWTVLASTHADCDGAPANSPPVITSFECPSAPVAVNTEVTLTGMFTDEDAGDTHTATIAWGDNGAESATVTPATGGGTVSGSHTYTAAGIYTPLLEVSDGTDSDTETCEYVVVYDPSAGFVTGGGWIWSPEGAYVGTYLTGKATFGFVSKYKKGATIPDGNTEFQFHAAGLNFKSTSYQWLVVSGSKATYKGYGTLNGVSGYGFLLSAVDGSPDKFRIKIWDSSDTVVYDNNVDVPTGDDADPVTALGGGSIVIHTGGKK